MASPPRLYLCMNLDPIHRRGSMAAPPQGHQARHLPPVLPAPAIPDRTPPPSRTRPGWRRDAESRGNASCRLLPCNASVKGEPPRWGGPPSSLVLLSKFRRKSIFLLYCYKGWILSCLTTAKLSDLFQNTVDKTGNYCSHSRHSDNGQNCVIPKTNEQQSKI